MFETKFIALLAGMMGGLARWFSEIVNGNKSFVIWHFPMIMLIGSFLGFLGGEILVEYLHSPHLAGLAGGVSGAMGSYGFDFYIKKLSNITKL